MTINFPTCMHHEGTTIEYAKDCALYMPRKFLSRVDFCDKLKNVSFCSYNYNEHFVLCNNKEKIARNKFNNYCNNGGATIGRVSSAVIITGNLMLHCFLIVRIKH